jgi:hypothetical protein
MLIFFRTVFHLRRHLEYQERITTQSGTGALCSACKDLSRNQPELELTDRVDALLRLSFADWTLAASQPSQSLPCSVSNTSPGAISQSAGCAHDRALSDLLRTVRLTKISWTVASFPKLLKFVGRLIARKDRDAPLGFRTREGAISGSNCFHGASAWIQNS